MISHIVSSRVIREQFTINKWKLPRRTIQKKGPFLDGVIAKIGGSEGNI